MAQTPLTDLPLQSDLIISEWDTRHSREEIDVSGYDFSAVANVPKQLLGWLTKADGTLAIDGEEASVVGVLITHDRLQLPDAEDSIDNANAGRFLQIVRGPAILKKSQINVTDVAGATIDIDAVVTQLKTLGITVLEGATETETQGAH